MKKLAKRLVSPDSGLVCPDHWSGPDWVYTDGPAVADLNASAGFAPDPQQELGLDLIFAVGENGLPAAFSFCIICCRQNMKTGLLKQAAVGWLYVTDERLVVWSAHELSTTTEAQRELGELMESSPALAKRMPAQKNRGIYEDNNKTRIELTHNGFTQQIRFKARVKTGGRGLSGDKVVLDEAFALEASHVGSLLPTMAARPHGQVLYASSAGLLDSAVLRDARDRGRVGSSPRMFYLEWGGAWRECADPFCAHPKDAEQRGIDCALDDRELWRHNNPTVSTGRISEQTIADLRQELPPEEFARECMGRWDDAPEGGQAPAISARRWGSNALRQPEASPPVKACVVLDIEPDRSVTSIGVAGRNPDGQLIVLEHTAAGEAWVVDRLKHLRDTVQLLEVALHPSGQAKTLIPALTAAGFPFTKLTHNDLAGGCSSLISKVEAGDIVHVGQLGLDTAVAVARTRYVGESQRWARGGAVVPLAPLVSTSTALYRFELLDATPQKEPPPAPLAVPTTAQRSSRPADDPATAGF